MKTANITPYWHSHASPTAAAGATNRKEQVLRTASIRLLALTLLAAPAAVAQAEMPPQVKAPAGCGWCRRRNTTIPTTGSGKL